MIVIDASAAVDLFSRAPAFERVADRIGDEFVVHVPAVFDVEVLSALRGLEASGSTPPEKAEAALVDLEEMRAVRHDHAPLRRRIWELRRNLSPYDAAYVALAELLDAALITRDRALARASGHSAQVEVV